MGKKAKWKPHQRRYIDGKQAYRKMLPIISY